MSKTFFSFSVCLVFLALVCVDVSNAEHKSDEPKVYEISKGNFSLKVTNLGATILSVILPDKQGKLADVVLGHESLDTYKNNTPYFGALVGRVANRIGGAKFTLNGTTYKLDANEGKNILHGGHKGFNRKFWKVRKHKKEGHAPYIIFTYLSADGEEGFPGSLAVTVSYMLLEDYKLSVVMTARAVNKATPVNLAQHSYWNLGGHNSGDILSNTLQLFASHITPTDESLIPTGKIVPVKGTPYDFLESKTVGSRINKLPNLYDINYVIDGPQGVKMNKAAVVHDSKSGRVLELWTNKPGVQFYTANYVNDVKGKGGYTYMPHAALCLETQGFPDAVNHPNFPSVIVNPGKPYKHLMLYKFSTK
ncbi:hypothetical protein GIB67_005012 [Kingdonia uniflora]|uniref:Aldose 1-epimerase n=1 Tax=Kingdonia uniflora TaxID=39325 RepID=A0A7J7NN60_9MAGN|nr:hypothetical protein GIB67_005012 [Kingdonia uniflora]